MFRTFLKLLVFFGLCLLVSFRLPSPAISQEVEAWTNMGIERSNTNVTAKKIETINTNVTETWTNMGLYGGQILDIAINPDNADKIFAGAYMGDGLYVTENGGKSWEAADDIFKNRAVSTRRLALPRFSRIVPENMFKNRAVSAVKIAPSNNNIIWVAHNCRVEKSTDGGQSWTHVAQDAIQSNYQDCRRVDDSHRSCISLAINPYDAQTVYMGTTGPNQGYYAIYKTEDGGKTWTNTNQENYFDCRVVDIDIDPQNTKNIWAVTSPMGDKSSCPGRLYRSGDSGKTWENIMTQQLGFTTVVVNPKDSNRVFTGSYSNEDSGIKEHYFNGDKLLYSRPCIPIDGGDSVVLDIAFAPQDPYVLYAAWKNIIKPGDTFSDVSRKVSRSEDGGKHWETYTVDYEFSSIAVHPEDSRVIFGGERYLGIYKSQNYGKSWYAVNNGISSALVYDMAIDPNDSTHILAGTISGVYKKKQGEPWKRLLEHGTYSLEFHPKDSLTFYAGINGRLAKTTDDGVTWTYSELLNSSRVNDIAIDPDNDTVYIAASDYLGKIYKNENGEDSFEVLIAEKQSDFNVVTLDPLEPQHLFAGGGGLWESIDGGENWEQTGLKGKTVNAILIHPEEKTMYAGCSHSISAKTPLYKSIDGDPWQPIVRIPSISDMLVPEIFDGKLTEPERKTVNDIFIGHQNPKIMNADGHSISAKTFLYNITDGSITWQQPIVRIPSIPELEPPFFLTELERETVNDIFIQNSKIMNADGHSISAKTFLYNITDGSITWQQPIVRIPPRDVTDSAALPLYKSTNFLHYDGNTLSFMRDRETSNMASLYKSTESLIDSLSETLDPEISDRDRAVTDLEFHPTDMNIIYASTYGAGVYISPDRGENWLNLGTPEHNVHAISTSSLFITTDGGMFQCTGTGLIAGKVTDTEEDGIDGADIKSGVGGMGKSMCRLGRCTEDCTEDCIEDYTEDCTCGDYLLVTQAGVSTVTATATGYETVTATATGDAETEPPVTITVNVNGGDVTVVDFEMQLDDPENSSEFQNDELDS